MGFMENLARKSEFKAREKMFDAFSVLGQDIEWGGVPLPCHIIEETHHGIYIVKGETVLVTYACQGTWWGYQLNPKLLEALQGSMAFSVHSMFGTLSHAEPLAPYPGTGAVPTAASFAYAVTQIEDERGSQAI